MIALSLAIVSTGSTENTEDESKANDCSARPEALTIVALG
jgi:hypothetical protein